MVLLSAGGKLQVSHCVKGNESQKGGGPCVAGTCCGCSVCLGQRYYCFFSVEIPTQGTKWPKWGSLTLSFIKVSILYLNENHMIRLQAAPGTTLSARSAVIENRCTDGKEQTNKNKVELVKVCQNLNERVDVFCMSGYKQRIFPVHCMRDFKLQYCRRWKICIRCSCNIKTFSHAHPKEQTLH